MKTDDNQGFLNISQYTTIANLALGHHSLKRLLHLAPRPLHDILSKAALDHALLPRVRRARLHGNDLRPKNVDGDVAKHAEGLVKDGRLGGDLSGNVGVGGNVDGIVGRPLSTSNQV